MADRSPTRRIHPRIAPLAALVVGHAASDACINFIPPLWPEFQAKLGITATQIGIITGLVSITTNFGQPLFGYLADRFRIPHMVALGPAIAGLFIGLMALPEHVFTLGAAYMIAGVGTALFHPQGATLAGRVAGSRRGLGMAAFSAGGAVGYGAGALVGVLLFERFGWSGLFGATILGGLTAAMLFGVHPGARYPDTATEPMRFRTHVRPHLHRVGVLFSVVALRAVVIIVFTNFVALGVQQWGGSTLDGAWLISTMIVAGGVGDFLGGTASDHIGRRRVTVVSLLLSAPAFAAFLHFGLPTGYWLLPVAGLLGQAAVSVNVVQGQELMPGAQGVASSLTMGAAWGVAGLLLPLAGAAADAWGALTMLSVVAWVPALAGVLGLWVPERQ
ncbi:MAG: MFS transporter [Armatimonadota bacterium]|jgi:FSR family fosmidomycin resistance protein-like MFS transporter